MMIELPAELEAQLRARFGERLDREAKEAVGIALYRAAMVSIGQLAQMLGLGVIETEGWLAQRGVALPLTEEELRAELEGVRGR